jgi:hypothetical protein
VFRKIEKRTAATQAEGSKLEGKEEYDSFLIKRKLISMEIEISAKDQYETFSQKLPFKAQKVVGVAICSSVSSLQVPAILGKCYFGIGLDENPSEIFIKSLESKQILPEWMLVAVKKCYPYDEGDDDDDDRNTWTYYAQPKRLGTPVLKIDGFTWKFRSPVIISALDDETGVREDYFVWRSQENNLGELEIEIIQQQSQP